MSKQWVRLIFGALLILAGGFFLLQQLFNIPLGGVFIALIFIAAGVVFLLLLLRDKTKWWWAIPGFTLIGLGAIIAMGKLIPAVNDRIGGSVFLGSIAVAFLVVYLLKRDHWWPIIPAGVLATLALVAGIPGPGGTGGAVFFLGLGITFGVLGMLPSGKAEKWPWIPAGICLGLGLLILFTSGALFNTATAWIWAVIFIAAGAFFVIRSLIKKE